MAISPETIRRSTSGTPSKSHLNSSDLWLRNTWVGCAISHSYALEQWEASGTRDLTNLEAVYSRSVLVACLALEISIILEPTWVFKEERVL